MNIYELARVAESLNLQPRVLNQGVGLVFQPDFEGVPPAYVIVGCNDVVTQAAGHVFFTFFGGLYMTADQRLRLLDALMQVNAYSDPRTRVAVEGEELLCSHLAPPPAQGREREWLLWHLYYAALFKSVVISPIFEAAYTNRPLRPVVEYLQDFTAYEEAVSQRVQTACDLEATRRYLEDLFNR